MNQFKVNAIKDENDSIEQYLDLTGQTFHTYGMDFIISLAERALKGNKKIIWKDDPGLIYSVLFEFVTIQ